MTASSHVAGLAQELDDGRVSLLSAEGYVNRGSRVTQEGGPFMKAVVWYGNKDVRVETVPDPRIEQPTDAIIRVTSSGLCGSDLHLYSVLGMFMTEGDILGHEPMGIVEEVGAAVTQIAPRERVGIPFYNVCGLGWGWGGKP